MRRSLLLLLLPLFTYTQENLPTFSRDNPRRLVVVDGGKRWRPPNFTSQSQSDTSILRSNVNRPQSDSMTVLNRSRRARAHQEPPVGIIFAPIDGSRVLTKTVFMNANSEESSNEQFKIYEHFATSKGQSILAKADPFFVTDPPRRTTIATPVDLGYSENSVTEKTQERRERRTTRAPSETANFRSYPSSPKYRFQQQLMQRPSSQRSGEESTRQRSSLPPAGALVVHAPSLTSLSSPISPSSIQQILPSQQPLRQPITQRAEKYSSTSAEPEAHDRPADPFNEERVRPIAPRSTNQEQLSPPLLEFSTQETESLTSLRTVDGVPVTMKLTAPRFRPLSGSFAHSRMPNKPIPLPSSIEMTSDDLPDFAVLAFPPPPQMIGEFADRRRVPVSAFSVDAPPLLLNSPLEAEEDKPSLRLRKFLTRYPHLQPQPVPYPFVRYRLVNPQDRPRPELDPQQSIEARRQRHLNLIDRQSERQNLMQRTTMGPKLAPSNFDVAANSMSRVHPRVPPLTAFPPPQQQRFNFPPPQYQQKKNFPPPQYQQPNNFPTPLPAPNRPDTFEQRPIMREVATAAETPFRSFLSPNQKLDSCCRRQQVNAVCQNLCNFDSFDDKTLVAAFITNQCPGEQLGKAFDCASTKANHVDCCHRGGLGNFLGGKCLPFCSTHLGSPSNVLEYLPCLQVFRVIRDCYKDFQIRNPNIFGE